MCGGYGITKGSWQRSLAWVRGEEAWEEKPIGGRRAVVAAPAGFAGCCLSGSVQSSSSEKGEIRREGGFPCTPSPASPPANRPSSIPPPPLMPPYCSVPPDEYSDMPANLAPVTSRPALGAGLLEGGVGEWERYRGGDHLGGREEGRVVEAKGERMPQIRGRKSS